MRKDRAWYEQDLADYLRANYAYRRDEAAMVVREYGGEVSFPHEPDWETRAKELIETEIVKMACEAIRARMNR